MARVRRAFLAPAHRDASEGWMSRAACSTVDAELFFPQNDESMPERLVREERAKAVCAGCPVRRPCLAYAVRSGIRFGIWGGLNEKERDGRDDADDDNARQVS